MLALANDVTNDNLFLLIEHAREYNTTTPSSHTRYLGARRPRGAAGACSKVGVSSVVVILVLLILRCVAQAARWRVQAGFGQGGGRAGARGWVAAAPTSISLSTTWISIASCPHNVSLVSVHSTRICTISSAPRSTPHSRFEYASEPYCSGSSTNSASGLSVSCSRNSVAVAPTTSAVTPRNILKPALAMTSPVSWKDWHVPICALARNSSTSRTPML